MHNIYTAVLEQELVPALGCTEPTAAALAVAAAAEELGEPVERVCLHVSPNVLKNAMGVGIPGTSMVGLEIAAALAAVCGKSRYRLEVLRDMTPADVEAARKMAGEKRIQVVLEPKAPPLYIRAECKNRERIATAVIRDTHTNLTLVDCGEKGWEGGGTGGMPVSNLSGEVELSLAEIFRYAATVEPRELRFLREGIEMNERIAQAGLSGEYGAGIGRSLMAGAGQDWAAHAAACAAAASDARMTGCPLPVMSAAGSGNQGLTAIVPVVSVGRSMEAGEEAVLRAVALSLLVTIHLKRHIGKLSAICGCAIAASVGASCGIVLLHGGGPEQMEAAVNNMVGDISGMICDGAKAGCALKIATAVSGAYQCACLALNGVVISDKDGIICRSAEDTVRNLGRLAREGMAQTDRVILDMMICK